MIDRRGLKAHYPFGRLDRLLGGIEPDLSDLPARFGEGRPIALSVGDPQRQPPAMVAETLAEHAAGWSRYPPGRGTPAFVEACIAWLLRRYGLPDSLAAKGGMLDPARAVLPLPGSREGLFVSALACTEAAAAGETPPLVLVPNPFYHVYAGAAAAAGCEAVFVPASAENGFLPDFGALPPEVLDRAGLCFLCTPANPQGAAASLEQLKDLIRLARKHDFVVAFDECYTEVYNREPPAGALQAAHALGGGLDRVLLFHSLSKRSSAAGLRCGFVAGDPEIVERLDFLFRTGGAGVPFPTLAAGARLWSDDAHAAETRAFYQANFAIAERVLGNRFGYRQPDGGFFLWLDVGNGEAAALELWRRAGIKVLPGGYMSAGKGAWGLDDETAAELPGGGENPGEAYIRVALVYGPELTEAALNRLAEIL